MTRPHKTNSSIGNGDRNLTIIEIKSDLLDLICVGIFILENVACVCKTKKTLENLKQ